MSNARLDELEERGEVLIAHVLKHADAYNLVHWPGRLRTKKRFSRAWRAIQHGKGGPYGAVVCVDERDEVVHASAGSLFARVLDLLDG